ncbi:GPI-linked NAD(P)(+)--arginine ADP-ribosyltransferase 1-like, partial [Neopelma chrysocephalum]|uniref:GPI-linked NAD(P)(+)--arginine ADP-ribosyltransferase 1-like n=1 Tax=Neopelma chrysocephalum TaxID=114329 RepID=UPI000FCD29D7
MALLTLLLALPALAWVTPPPPTPQGTIQEVTLDMAPSAFDDRYRGCGPAMAAALPALNRSEFPLNADYAAGWALAAAEWRVRGSPASPKTPLSPEQAVALLAYTAPVPLHRAFNAASRAAGRSRRHYREGFHFKALHFLLTGAVGELWEKQGRPCRRVFRGVSGVRFRARAGSAVRFGHFASASRRNGSAWAFGADTAFEVLTCHGAAVREFSFFPEEDEVLIPPYETFEVVEVAGGGKDGVRIWLRSAGTLSNYNCEWLR